MVIYYLYSSLGCISGRSVHMKTSLQLWKQLGSSLAWACWLSQTCSNIGIGRFSVIHECILMYAWRLVLVCMIGEVLSARPLSRLFRNYGKKEHLLQTSRRLLHSTSQFHVTYLQDQTLRCAASFRMLPWHHSLLQSNQGPFQSALILKVFALQQSITNKIPVSYRNPIGRLALCAAAVCTFDSKIQYTHNNYKVEHALDIWDIWKEGTNASVAISEVTGKKVQRSRGYKFGNKKWGRATRNYAKTIASLKDHH